MSFLAPDYHDRRMPLSGGDVKEVRRQAWKLWFADRRNLSLYILAIVAMNAAFGFAFEAMMNRVAQPTAWHWIGGGAVFFILLYGMILSLQRWRFRPLIWRVLRGQGFEVDLKTGRWSGEADPK